MANGANDDNIVTYFQEYVDCTCKMTTEEVFAEWKVNTFRSLDAASVVNRGVTDCQHWFVFQVHNASPYREEYLWSFYNDGIRFSVFEFDALSGKIGDARSVSHRVPIGDREVAIRSISFPVLMEAGESKSFLLKTVLKGRQNLYFPTDFSTKSDILQYELEFSFLLGRYYGFFFYAIAFNLCLYLVLKKKFYLVMLGNVSSLLAFSMVEYLHDVYLIPSWIYPFWANIPKLIFIGLTLYFNVYVFIAFVQQYKYLPKLAAWLRWANRLVLVSTVGYLLIYWLWHSGNDNMLLFQKLFIAVMLLQTFLLLVNIVAAACKRTPFIWHYIAGNTLLFASMIFYLFNTFNIVYFPQFFRPGNIIFSFSVECIYLTIIFTVKYKRDFDKFTADILAGEEKSRRLSRQLIRVQEKERERLAQDIHDGIGGSLQGLRFMLAGSKDVVERRVFDVLDTISEEFRSLINRLAPRHLQAIGLFAAIKRDIQAYAVPMDIRLQCLGDDKRLDEELSVTAFRIYQELLSNVFKHASSTKEVEVSVSVDGEELRILVEDYAGANGDEHAAAAGGGMGLFSIRSRAEYYGGRFHIDFTATGCCVLVEIPIRKAAEVTHD